ncbi:uncharacterized protein LOC113209737 isoform X3 [Frankliniella occidentalis]|uniref:Uncharacterized protein LOC113209737 isoform X3 n=1 Tax=Frankliniella occidentalis TaxID=133901 RepID=A0A9C6WPK2_FRAOC|nr:uncharacterized protein LOC113209737 isoform X3 [Frankliniella occidentalis]
MEGVTTRVALRPQNVLKAWTQEDARPPGPRQQRAYPQRPVSLYDNLKQQNHGANGNGCSTGTTSSGCEDGVPLVRGGASSVGNLHAVTQHAQLTERARTPSQANCLSTTVPQNIAPHGFASRHAPTRSSLRHSRMIVLTRDGRVPRKYQPGVLHSRRLGTALAALVSLLGALVTAVAVWLLLWAPHLPSRDVPVYSGPPVVSVAVAGLSALAALCASAFAMLHVVSLWGSACQPAKQVANATCTCEPAYKDPDRSWAIWAGTSRHVYPDLSCPEVESLLSVLLTGSGAANLVGGLLAGWYVLLHWRSRYTDVYAKVRTAPPPVVISNVSKA